MWFLVYYIVSFLLEEELLVALRAGGLRLVWRKSRLLSLEFCLLAYPSIIYLWTVLVPRGALELRKICLAKPKCRVHLRQRPAWLWAPVPWTGDAGEDDFSFVDGADIQWRDFRDSLPLLLGAAVLLAGLVRAALAMGVGSKEHLPERMTYVGVAIRLAVGLGFLFYVHGVGAVFPLVLIVVFYACSRLTAGSRLGAYLPWLLALAAIAAKEPKWPIRPRLTFGRLLGLRWRWLDGRAYQGEYDWAESVNLLVLRLVSFALDAHSAASVQKGSRASSSTAMEWRQRYSLAGSAAHALYAPLFLAGPTIRFDDFADQLAAPRGSGVSASSVCWYFAQLAVAVVLLEAGTSYVPCFALARSGELGRLSPFLGSIAVLLTLNTMWLKFLVIWRVARAWALADGINPPENMRRSLNNHYSVVSFWKSWHVSYNKWLVRYIYVPAGGKHRRVLATTVTFLFVSYWHDAEAKLLAWGGLNAAFIALQESVASVVQKRVEAMGLLAGHPLLYRWLCAAGGASCVFLLMAVNMIGYSIGLKGIGALLATVSSADARWEAVSTFAGAYCILTCGVMVMFEIRQLDGTYAAAPAAATVAPSPLPAESPQTSAAVTSEALSCKAD